MNINTDCVKEVKRSPIITTFWWVGFFLITQYTLAGFFGQTENKNFWLIWVLNPASCLAFLCWALETTSSFKVVLPKPSVNHVYVSENGKYFIGSELEMAIYSEMYPEFGEKWKLLGRADKFE